MGKRNKDKDEEPKLSYLEKMYFDKLEYEENRKRIIEDEKKRCREPFEYGNE